MTRVLVWKEVREQAAVMAALAVMGAAVLAAAATFSETKDVGRATELRSLTTAGRLGLLLLVLTAGVVAGGTLFAGEREAGTLTLLDRLPGSRLGVWWRKALAGAGLMAVAAAVLTGVAEGLGLLGSSRDFLAWCFLIATVVTAAFGWGALGSVVARSSLAACGLGVGLSGGAALLGFALFYVLIALLHVVALRLGKWYWWLVPDNRVITAFLATSFTLVLLPLPASAWLFSRPDRQRNPYGWIPARVRGRRAIGLSEADFRPSRRGFAPRRLLWLAARQVRVPVLVLGGVAAVVGCGMLPAESMPTLVWPPAAFVIGLLCGVITLADEQGSLAARFWGERRLPVGRVWLAKVAAGAAMTACTLVALALPLFVAAAIGSARGGLGQVVFRTGLFADPAFPVLTYLLIWPAYGFVFGHLFAVVFRKPIVAGAVGLMVGGTAAAVWLPSLLGGGLHLWQPLAPLAVALLTARLLAWAWAADQIASRRSLVRLGGGMAATTVLMAAGIAWRVAEVTPAAEGNDDLEFAAKLPTYDEKQPGRDLRRAVSLFTDLGADVINNAPARPLLPPPDAETQPAGADPRRARYVDRVYRVLEVGMPADRPDLDAWLDRAFVTRWDEPIYAAAPKPTGVLEDPNELAYYTLLKNLDALSQLGPVFLARALQKQARGDADAFVPALDAWLAAARTTRNNTVLWGYVHGRRFEQLADMALDRWLERLGDRPDLLRQVLRILQRHDAESKADERSVRLASQTIVRNAIVAPSRWLPRYLDSSKAGSGRALSAADLPGPFSTQSETETNLVQFAWTVPWERERHRRTVGLGNVPGWGMQEWHLMSGLPGAEALLPLIPDGPADMFKKFGTEDIVLAPRRAAVLKVALRLAEAEDGRLPATLDALVPKYLPAVPKDPYDRQPFRYRVSAGEVIEFDPTASPAANLPPGRVPEALSDDALTAVGGVAGSGICWPLVPFDMSEGIALSGGGSGAPAPEDPDDSYLAGVASVTGGPVFQTSTDTTAPFPIGGGAPPGRGRVSARGDNGLGPWRVTLAGREPVAVPAGQGILWSVGPDKIDDGGSVAYGPNNRSGSTAGDLIYLVPRPAKR